MMDSDGSGFVDQLELSHYILKQFGMSLGDTNMRDFAKAIKYYLNEFQCSNERPGELNKKEFLKFWEKFDELYRRIDANGDGSITMDELLYYLEAWN